MKVLIVDSDHQEVERLRNAFASREVFPSVAVNGLQAIHLVERFPYDALIVENKLPGVGGLQVMQVARLSPLNAKSLIYISASPLDLESVTRAKRLGVARIVKKPIEAADLVKQVVDDVDAKKRPIKYDVRLINSAIEASKWAFGTVLDHQEKTSPAYTRPATQAAKGFVSAVIDIVDYQIVGSMAISVMPALLFAMAKRVLGEAKPVKEDFEALTGSICKQMIRQLKLNLDSSKSSIAIGLPRMITGKSHRIIHSATNPILCVDVGVGPMAYVIEFCFEQKMAFLEGLDRDDAQQSLGGVLVS